jgi:hypothetical protein
VDYAILGGNSKHRYGSWTEVDGVIRFTVTSDGTTGPQWIERLEKQGYRVSGYALNLILSEEFKPTDEETHNVAVLKGELFNDHFRLRKNVHFEARRRGLMRTHPEVACLIRERFTNDEMRKLGLWSILVMHQPIGDAQGYPSLMSVRLYEGGRWLDAFRDIGNRAWSRDRGFAFVEETQNQ